MELKMEKINFKPDFMEMFNKYIKTKTLDITYYNGYLVKFDKCNLEGISPHKIVVSNEEKNLLIMHYADYAETDGLYYIDGIKEPFDITNLKKYIKKYF